MCHDCYNYRLLTSLLSGTADNPIPRIKLVFSSASSQSASSEDEDTAAALYARHYNAEKPQFTEDHNQDDSDTEEPSPSDSDIGSDGQNEAIAENSGRKHTLIEKIYGNGIIPQDKVTSPGSIDKKGVQGINGNGGHLGSHIAAYDEEDAAVLHGRDVLLSKYNLDDEAGYADGENDSPDDTTILAHTLRKDGRKRRPRQHRRELTINLEYGGEFFTLLNQALSSLTTLLQTEKQTFMSSVQELANSISQTSSPARNRNDLYAWRDVFSLWVEAQIFESESESTRGERSIAECEKRLDWFVDQVGRRKLAKKMKSKQSRKSLERFVELNQELLQLKRLVHFRLS